MVYICGEFAVRPHATFRNHIDMTAIHLTKYASCATSLPLRNRLHGLAFTMYFPAVVLALALIIESAQFAIWGTRDWIVANV